MKSIDVQLEDFLSTRLHRISQISSSDQEERLSLIEASAQYLAARQLSQAIERGFDQLTAAIEKLADFHDV
jgi:hypothetical protein